MMVVRFSVRNNSVSWLALSSLTLAISSLLLSFVTAAGPARHNPEDVRKLLGHHHHEHRNRHHNVDDDAHGNRNRSSRKPPHENAQHRAPNNTKGGDDDKDVPHHLLLKNNCGEDFDKNIDEEKWKCWIKPKNNIIPNDAVGSMSPNRTLQHAVPSKDPMMDMIPKKSLNYTLESKYMGVLLDAGRHYFPIGWLYRLIPILSAMQYNMLHFRFTDDQALAIRFESYPELSWPAPADGNRARQVYTTKEIQTFVQFARDQHNITIIPELNLPGHAGAWAGIPDLVVPCPNFACNEGYGIPLNITSPKFHTVVAAVLKETLDIFENPPFLHLGGDEVHMSKPCWDEATGIDMPVDYTTIEQTVLKKILEEELNYPLNQVVRWQMTGREMGHLSKQELPAYDRYYSNRVEGIRHFWHEAPGASQDYLPLNRPYFASANLYLDINADEYGWEIYAKTHRWHHLPESYGSPLAIIVGTFELGTDFWWHRNVIGRLLAATLGNVNKNFRSSVEFYAQYFHDCHETLGFPISFCRLYGGVPTAYGVYRKSWADMQKKWKMDICKRVAEDVTLHLPGNDQTFMRDHTVAMANEEFWNSFDTTTKREKDISPPPILEKNAFRLGIIIDAVSDHKLLLSPDSESFIVMKRQLGINMIQLRLMDDYGRLSQADLLKLQQTFIPLVSEVGIEVMPEASLSSTAGGWYDTSWTVPCPEYTCASGIHIPNNISCPDFLPVAWQTVQSLLPLKTSPYLHLGTDERQASLSCFQEFAEQQESNQYYDYFGLFEAKLQELFHIQQQDANSSSITPQTIVRWENEEHVRYPNRFGSITQCRDCQRLDDTTVTPSFPWFAHLDLYQFQSLYEIYNASFALSQQHPLGIVASFGSMSGDEGANDDIILRLIAFSFGATNATHHDTATFEQMFLEACKKNTPQQCEQHETLVNDYYNQHHARQQVRVEEHRKLVCKERTRWEHKRKWKDVIPTFANAEIKEK